MPDKPAEIPYLYLNQHASERGAKYALIVAVLSGAIKETRRKIMKRAILLIFPGCMACAFLAAALFTGCGGGASSSGDSGSPTALTTVAAPQFTPEGGFYSTAQTVTISCATEGATIRYTTDGSDPAGSGGTTYTGPITVAGDCVVKAVASKSGIPDSAVVTSVYALSGPGDAPLISTVTPGARSTTLAWQPVSGAIIYNLYYAEGTTVSRTTGTRIADVTSPCTVTGLKGGKTYAFIIVPLDSNGEGAASAVQTAVPQKAWAAKGAAGFSAGQVEYVSLAMDSGGNPYVAYTDNANGTRATVMRYSGTAWEVVGSAGFSANTAYFTSLALDSNNIPYVAYFDAANGGKATVMRYSGTGWQVVGSAGFSADEAWYISLAIDSNNTPYVAYMDSANGNNATVMRFNGASWELVGGAGFTSGQVDNSLSLALDSNNHPWVAYPKNSSNCKTTVMRYSGTAWETVGSAAFSAGSADYVSLALDSNNTPYVAYRDDANGGRATVMRYSGTAWQVVGSAGFSAGTANYTSLAIDSNNTPYVAYKDYGNGERATVMRYSGTEWEAVGGAGFSTQVYEYLSFALDPDNNPFVAYQDRDNSCRATVMSYE